MSYLKIARPIDTMLNALPIAEPYAPLVRLYTSQNGDAAKETRLNTFSFVIQNALF